MTIYPEKLIERAQLLDVGASHPSDFAIYVRLAREKRGLDRKQLAQKANLDPQFLIFLENGLNLPDELTEDICQRIEAALGISFGKFIKINQCVMEDLRRFECALAKTNNAGSANNNR